MINADVIVREVEDGAVLLHLKDGIYFGLDPLGLKIWNLLSDNRSREDIVKLLAGEYDASADVLEADLNALLDDLSSHGLVSSV